ncbi:MAG: GDYXXLXY domain-containing protein [Bacillota bacterium]|nr:GDYXXLXY domain-containing protein [Bacillota bacterium]
MRHRRWFFLTVAIQVLVLLGMAARHTYTVRTGQPVMLETAPVDPWSPLRGQYVRLSYKVSMLREGEVAFSGAPYRDGQRVWVTLRKGDPYWKAAAVSDRRPPAAAGEVAVLGTVQWMSWGGEASVKGPAEVSVRYGIEQFYVPEGEGQELESGASLSVEVRVDSLGRAALSRVFRDGKEITWQ